MSVDSHINIAVSFVAGLLSFLSPCVLAIAPAYVSYIAGTKALEGNRRDTLLHVLLFVLGFAGVFVLMGIGASFMGGLFFQYRTWFNRVAGFIIVLFGLQVMGILKLRFLYGEKRPQFRVQLGTLRSLVLGISFGLGWTPCVGPVLGSILLYVSALGRAWEGGMLLAFYALGLALPFLLLGAGWGWAVGLLSRLKWRARAVELVSGILLISLGLVLLFGKMSALLGLLGSFNPEAFLVK
jgi:cytochrome c-type biogenesis protein